MHEKRKAKDWRSDVYVLMNNVYSECRNLHVAFTVLHNDDASFHALGASSVVTTCRKLEPLSTPHIMQGRYI